MSEENKKDEVVQQHILDDMEKQKLKIKIIEDTIHDLKTNEKYRKYFSRFRPDSVESFINYYATRKSDFAIHGPMYKEQYIRKCEKFITEAKKYFPMIQKDKLLRLQYEWNEGNLELEGIESNFDFYPFYDDIFSCKLISPVDMEDVDILSEYFRTHNDLYYHIDFYPHYLVNGLIELSEDNPDYEEYQFTTYQEIRQAKRLEKPLLKESLKQAMKEQYYIAKCHEAKRKANPEMYETKHPVENRPMLSIHKYENVRKFIVKYENQELLNKYEAWYRAMNIENDMDDKINMAVWHLRETGENHPLEANVNWTQSILEAADKSKKEKTALALYLVYEEYLESLKNNTPFMPITEEKKSYNDVWQRYKINVLDGREACGEPRDFNF